MEINENSLKFISEESNVSLESVKRYYHILNNIPCVNNSNKHNFLNCLYLLIQLRKRNQFQKFQLPLEYNISDALYNVYKNESIDYLYPSYIVYNGIEKQKKLIKK